MKTFTKTEIKEMALLIRARMEAVEEAKADDPKFYRAELNRLRTMLKKLSFNYPALVAAH